MKRFSLAFVSDILFFSLCAFILCFALTRYFFRSAATAAVCAAGVAAAVGVLAYFLLSSRHRKKTIVSLGEKQKTMLSMHLSIAPKSKIISTFESALDGTYAADNRIACGEKDYFMRFCLSPISPDDVADVIRTDGDNQKVILCCEAGREALNLAENFGVKIMQIGEIYLTLKDKDLLPEKYETGNAKAPSRWAKIRSRFNRRLCPSLFFCGAALSFFSLFTFYPIYYVVSGGILLLLAAASVLIDPAK